MPPSPLSRAKKRLQTFLQTDLDYLVRGGSWLVVSQAGAALLSLATAVAFGHVAAADTYGNYKYVLALAGLFGAFSLTGIGTAVTQATARGLDGSLRQGVRLSLAWSWGVVVIALAAAGYYGFFVHNQFLALSLVIVALLSPVLNSFSLFDPYLIGKKRFDLNTILSFLNALVPVAAVIVTLFLTNRAIVIILVYFVANTLSDVVCYAITLRFAENDATDPKLLAYSGHLSVMGIINAIADKIDSIAIFAFLGPAELALYTFALAIPEQIKQLGLLITRIALPRFAARAFVEIRATLWRRIALFGVLLAIALGVYVLVAHWLFLLLFPRYLDAVMYSRWYAFSVVFTAVSAPLISVFQAHKKTRALYFITNGGALVLVVLVPLATYWYGIAGAIASQFAYRFATALIAAVVFISMKDTQPATLPDSAG